MCLDPNCASLASSIVDGRWHLHFQSVHIWSQYDLATQSRCVAQIVGQIQHVHLLIARFRRQFIVIWFTEYQMAGGAGQCTLARSKSIQVDVVINDNVQKVVAHFAGARQAFAARSDKYYSDSAFVKHKYLYDNHYEQLL